MGGYPDQEFVTRCVYVKQLFVWSLYVFCHHVSIEKACKHPLFSSQVLVKAYLMVCLLRLSYRTSLTFPLT